jgi:hypothetical protein
MREEADVYVNDAYLDAEEATMRVGKTSSLNLVRAKGQHFRQFQLSPKHLHFGTVVLGQVVHKVARLTNISNEIARFTLVRERQPSYCAWTLITSWCQRVHVCFLCTMTASN